MSHFLVVEDLGDGEFDRTVQHEPDCPTVVQYRDPWGISINEHVCDVGNWVSWYGFDDLVEDPRFCQEGSHEISFYSNVPDSMFEDGEQYLEYVDV